MDSDEDFDKVPEVAADTGDEEFERAAQEVLQKKSSSATNQATSGSEEARPTSASAVWNRRKGAEVPRFIREDEAKEQHARFLNSESFQSSVEESGDSFMTGPPGGSGLEEEGEGTGHPSAARREYTPQKTSSSHSRPRSATAAGGGIAEEREGTAAGSGGSRPGSARARREVERLSSVAAREWSVSEVCLWVETMGMPQHKMKFAHNQVSGRLLLRLTSENLKEDLGILPLGHRDHLLEGIAQLKAGNLPQPPKASSRGPSPAASPRISKHSGANRSRPSSAPRERPGSAGSSAHLGSAGDYMDDNERRQRLESQAEKARKRVQKLNAKERDIHVIRSQAMEEMNRYEGAVKHLDRNRRKSESRAPLQPKEMSHIPWRPGHDMSLHVDTKARDYHHMRAEPNLTFKPQIDKGSKRLLQETQGDNPENKDIVQRLAQADLLARKTKMKERERHYNELAAGGIDAIKEKQMKDDKFLRDMLREKFNLKVKAVSDEMVAQLLQDYSREQFGLSEKQWTSLEKMNDERKRAELEEEVEDCLSHKDKMAAQVRLNRFEKQVARKRRAWLQDCLRTNSFLARCRGDMDARQRKANQKQQEIKQAHKVRSQVNPLGSRAFSKSAAKLSLSQPQCSPADLAREFFRQRLGWWDPKDEQREEDIREADLDGDVRMNSLVMQREQELDHRLAVLLDLALDERGLMDGTQTRRETDGVELGRLACEYGVPRFVPSVRREHFRQMSDLGLDEVVHLLAQLQRPRLLEMHQLNTAKKEVTIYKAVKQQLFVYCMQRDAEMRDAKLAAMMNVPIKSHPNLFNPPKPGEMDGEFREMDSGPPPSIGDFLVRTEEDLRRRREKALAFAPPKTPFDDKPKWRK